MTAVAACERRLILRRAEKSQSLLTSAATTAEESALRRSRHLQPFLLAALDFVDVFSHGKVFGHCAAQLFDGLAHLAADGFVSFIGRLFGTHTFPAKLFLSLRGA